MLPPTLPNLVTRSCFNRKGEIFKYFSGHSLTLPSPDHTWLDQGLNFFFRQASNGLLFISSVLQSSPSGLVTPPSGPSASIIFLEPSRKNKRHLGGSLCICSSLSRNVCLDTARESRVYSGKEQPLTLSRG